MATLHLQLSAISEAIPRLFSIVRTRQEAIIDTLYNRILSRIQQKIVRQQADIQAQEQRLPMLFERKMTSERHRIEIIEERIKLLDPNLLLKRGYSITFFKGKAVRDPKLLQKGDEIETRIEKGTIKSIIK